MWSRRHGTSEQAWPLAQFNIGDHEQKLIKYTYTDCYNGWYSGRKQTGAALNYLEKEAAWTLRSRRNLAHLSNHYWWNDGNLCHVSHSSVVRCMVNVCGCLWHSCLASVLVSCVCLCAQTDWRKCHVQSMVRNHVVEPPPYFVGMAMKTAVSKPVNPNT